MADIVEVLWNDLLRHNPANPQWIDRDRFVVSNGHASMMLYSLLHLSGYDLGMEEIKNFRQLHSKTPGHPEYNDTPGVETTTGPLGQGIANAVGMAIAERTLAAQFNHDDFDIINHFTYVTVGDGCLMEGISHEACSLAGTLGLGKLIAIFDSNGISIDGEIKDWFTDDIAMRFESYHWHVIRDIDGHDPEAVKKALNEARSVTDKPSLICCRTIIGWGSPNKEGTESTHGAPLGEEEVQLVRKRLNWNGAPFEISPEYYDAWNAHERGARLESEWHKKFDSYREKYPEHAAELQRRTEASLPDSWQDTVSAYIDSTIEKAEKIASRKASQNSLEAYGPVLPELIGGSADLTPSNLTNWSGSAPNNVQNPAGNYLHYGVREFAMFAINNGISLHGGFIPYAGTFLIFSDYARNAIRMAALMKQRSILVFTHDSIGLGEDGPTHQAVEQAASLRLIPNMSTWRPCDAVETAVSWAAAIENKTGPTSLLLSRQSLLHIERSAEQVKNIRRGGYILSNENIDPDVIVIATGSEVEIALAAAELMQNEKITVRVVSMPSTDVFDRQDETYRNGVLPPDCRKRIAIEAGIPDYWYKYVGLDGRVIGVSSFGESAPMQDVYRHFNITTENLVTTIKSII
jgi:transketolase